MFKNYCKNCDDNRLKDFELKIKERLVFLIDLYASGYNSHKWLREIYDGGCCKKNEPHLSCRGEYCEKDDCDSYAFCSHIIAKTALDRVKTTQTPSDLVQ